MRTLRFLPLALLLLGLVPQAHAQLQFGIRAGLNLSDLASDDAIDSDPRLGFHGGVTATYPLGTALFIQPEVLYSQKGAGFSEDNEQGSYNIDYLDIPLLFGYSLPTATNLLVQFYAGPQLSVKVNESIRADGIGVDFDLIKDTDFGLVLGGDVGAVRVGTAQSFGVGLRYALGLTDIIDNNPLTEGASSVTNRVLSVSAFYRF